MNKRDIIALAIGVIVILLLWIAPNETTSHLPHDAIHAKFYKIVHEQGKKAAEKSCQDCHGQAGLEFPPGHPDPNRCLFCHKAI